MLLSTGQDLKDSVARIAQFLEKPLDADVIDKIVERCLFKNMKKNNMSNYSKAPVTLLDQTKSEFLRKGVVDKLLLIYTHTHTHLYIYKYVIHIVICTYVCVCVRLHESFDCNSGLFHQILIFEHFMSSNVSGCDVSSLRIKQKNIFYSKIYI